MPKAHRPADGQREMNLFPEESLPLKQRFQDVPLLERELRIAITREREHIRSVLNAIMRCGKSAGSEEKEEAVWKLAAKMDRISDPDLAKEFAALELPHDDPVRSGMDIAIVSVKRALKKSRPDSPDEMLKKLVSPDGYSKMKSLLNYALRQGLTTQKEVDDAWVSHPSNQARGKDGVSQEALPRVYWEFLYHILLPEWRKRAQERLGQTQDAEGTKTRLPEAQGARALYGKPK